MLPCLIERGLKNVRDGLISIAYPEDCRLCGDSLESWDDGVVCHRCWTDPQITKLFVNVSLCPKCGAPLTTRSLPNDVWQSGARRCSRCALLPLTAARACGAYSGALEASVIFLKSRPHLCKRLRDLIGRTYLTHRNVLSSDLLIPMPLHGSREKERGFNQALIVARTLKELAGSRLDRSSLSRSKHTDRHRAGMDARDRARSVEGAFRVSNPAAVNSARVLLVDDVYTTGSTASAAAEALIRAGAAGVSLFTVARVI